MSRKKIIFLIGSPNQTTQMHQISTHLCGEFDCYFSQLFANHFMIRGAVKLGLLDHTVLAGEFKSTADKYLEEHNLKNDYAVSRFKNSYDLVFACTDMIVPKILRGIKTIWVQEGMIDRITLPARITRYLKLPRYLAMNTSLNGASNICDIYCTGSQGYKNHIVKMGTDCGKVVVTGIPNFDNLREFQQNDFPYRDYVLVATSDIRECFQRDDRPEFIQNAVRIAGVRKLIFKLHPNEVMGRAIREIQEYAPPDTLILTEGNTNHMIVNCSELITQYSTVVYAGIVLGKKVHSYFDIDELNSLIPIQNGGKSAQRIADISRRFLNYKGSGTDFLKQYIPPKPVIYANAS
jgi:hypothetical protein